jgi:hypothetical protein
MSGFYEDGLKDYLASACAGWELLPAEPFVGSFYRHHRGGGLGGIVAAGRRVNCWRNLMSI